jgi:hypothetical protein
VELMSDAGPEYVAVRPWSNRAFSMPALTGGSLLQIQVLRILLTSLKDGIDPNEPITIPGEPGTTTTISAMGQRLQPAGLVTRTGRNSWILTPASEAWLHSGDNGFLISVLHSNIRFVGELLNESRQGRTQNELLEIAADKYGCSWNTLDQIHRRTAWLRSGGFLELDFRRQVKPTAAGNQLCERLELAQPGAASRRPPMSAAVATLSPAHDLVGAALESTDLSQRKPYIGYIPRSEGDALRSLRKFSLELKEEKTREEIDRFASVEFGLRPASTASALNTLKNAGLVEKVGFNAFKSTELAIACASAELDLDFLRVLHTRFRFFGEILEALEEVDTPRDLAEMATARYGLPREDIAEVRTRLQMFRQCGLIEEATFGHYRLLPMGRALLAEMPSEVLDSPEAEPAKERNDEGDSGSPTVNYQKLSTELRAASRASANPERFEKAVANAFSYLGFDEQLLGGSGQTDVLITAGLPGDMRYSAIVDAKSSTSGKIGEQHINFDTLKEHKTANSAEYILVVGPSFPGARLVARAETHGIGLLDVEQLCEIVKQHADAPLTLTGLRNLCDKTGLVTASVLERNWSAEKRAYRLCDRVLRQLALEAANADTFTTGALSAHDLYLILRSEAADPPTPPEIESVLSFLSSDLVHAVRKNGTQYVILEDPLTTARRLQRFASSILTDAMD